MCMDSCDQLCALPAKHHLWNSLWLADHVFHSATPGTIPSLSQLASPAHGLLLLLDNVPWKWDKAKRNITVLCLVPGLAHLWAHRDYRNHTQEEPAGMFLGVSTALTTTSLLLLGGITDDLLPHLRWAGVSKIDLSSPTWWWERAWNLNTAFSR